MTFSQDAFMQQLMATFVAEAQEHLHLISQGLLRLESEADAATVDALLAEMFRAAHSLKGAARAVGAAKAGDLAHALESVMGVMRTGGFRPDSAQFDLLYQTVDVLGALTNALVSGERPDVDAATLVDRLTALSVNPPAQTATPSLAPPKTQPHRATANADAPSVSPVGAATQTPLPAQPPTTPAAPAYTPPAVATLSPTPDESVRVTTVKLDALIEQVGELRVAQLTSTSHLRP